MSLSSYPFPLIARLQSLFKTNFDERLLESLHNCPVFFDSLGQYLHFKSIVSTTVIGCKNAGDLQHSTLPGV